MTALLDREGARTVTDGRRLLGFIIPDGDGFRAIGPEEEDFGFHDNREAARAALKPLAPAIGVSDHD